MGVLRRAIDRYFDRRLVDAGDRALELDQRWAHLLRHGSFPLAYAAVSETYVKSFGDAHGFLAYGQKMGETIVLGDPLVSTADAPGLIDEFIARMGRPSFAAVGEATAALLAARGYRVNAFGYDSVIDLAGHSFAGKDGKRIRYATSWLGAQGMRVEERPIEDFSRTEIEAMSVEWRKTRVVARREIRFLNREFAMHSELGVRRFFALSAEGRPQGLVSFDPVFREGETIGYLASNKRRYPQGSAYLDLAIMRHAIDCFRQEGREALWLGLSPLAPAGPSPFRDDPVVRRLFAHAFRSSLCNRKLFSLQGVAEYKNRFRGRRVPAYVAFPPGFNLHRVIALFRLIRVL